MQYSRIVKAMATQAAICGALYGGVNPFNRWGIGTAVVEPFILLDTTRSRNARDYCYYCGDGSFLRTQKKELVLRGGKNLVIAVRSQDRTLNFD